MKCWATSLGDCGGVQSLEHYMTKALFNGPHVTLKGLPWCRSDPRTIPLSRAGANILCQNHNTALSSVDAEISKLQKAIVHASRKPRLNREGKLRSPPRRFAISGSLLSRWLSKTFCNFATLEKRQLSEDLVRHAFGLRCTTNRLVYVICFKGLGVRPTDDHVQFGDFFDEEGHVICWARIADFRWFLSDVRLSELGDVIELGDERIKSSSFIEKIRGADFSHKLPNGRTVRTTRIDFDW